VSATTVPLRGPRIASVKTLGYFHEVERKEKFEFKRLSFAPAL
jgi:hypothetical protein